MEFKFKDVFKLGGGTENLERFALIFSICLLSALIIGSIIAFLILRKKNPNIITTKDITYGSICLALSYVLSFIGISMPQGGTITPAATLPIMIFCYFFGFRKSLIVVVAYTMLQLMQKPYIVHPMSAILDYIIPYLSLIFFAIFSNNSKKPLFKNTANQNETDSDKTTADTKQNLFIRHQRFFAGAVCYVFVRYFSHVLSGAIFFGEWAQWGLDPWPYSFVYNLFFVLDAVIALVCCAALLSSKTFCRHMTITGYTLQNADTGKKHN